MFSRFLIVSMIILFAGCDFFRAPGQDHCEKIISREKMADILADVYLLEGFLQEVKVTSPQLNDTIRYYYAGLFERHGVNRWQFEEALSCYLLNENDIQYIHDDILQRFSILESEIESLDKPESMSTRFLHPLVFFPPDTLDDPFHAADNHQWWRLTLPDYLFSPVHDHEQSLEPDMTNEMEMRLE
jgi:hypothetical protein